MVQATFSELESVCDSIYNKYGKFYHVCTPENHPIILRDREDFVVAMSIIGLCAKIHKDIIIIAFQLMSNHLHMALCGTMSLFSFFFDDLKRFLNRYFQSKYGNSDLKQFNPNVIEIKNLENLRNVITYINRNGYVISPNDTPFSYEWGSNRFYFNPEAKKRYESEKRSMTQSACQRITHSRKCDHLSGIYVVDEYVSPMCFCDIPLGETFFRNARHYFSRISRNIESQAEIAALIGEQAYFTDDDLFLIIQSIAKDKYGVSSPSQLPIDTKINVAKMMHFDYKASNKQIQRILKMETSFVNSLFPLSAKQ